MDAQTVEKASGGTARQLIKLRSGLDKDLAKTITKRIKEMKLKVNAQIQGETVRVSGAKRDDLQSVIANFKSDPPEVPLQFTNYR